MVYFVLTSRCFAYRHAATTFYQLQRGFGGRRQHERIQEFLSVLFSPQLILQLKEGLRKLYLYLTNDPEAVHYFPGGGGGGSNFFQGGGGVLMLISIETHIYLLFSRGSVLTPYPPLDPHMGNVIITGQYLSQSGL